MHYPRRVQGFAGTPLVVVLLVAVSGVILACSGELDSAAPLSASSAEPKQIRGWRDYTPDEWHSHLVQWAAVDGATTDAVVSFRTQVTAEEADATIGIHVPTNGGVVAIYGASPTEGAFGWAPRFGRATSTATELAADYLATITQQSSQPQDGILSGRFEITAKLSAVRIANASVTELLAWWNSDPTVTQVSTGIYTGFLDPGPKERR